MSAGMYDVNGKPLMQPRNVMTEFNNVADNFTQFQIGSATQASAPDMKFMPATERAIQESQLAMQREMEKQKRLEEFQKKTKKAATNYGHSLKSEQQVKQEKTKQEAEIKQKKVKEFEEKLKNMRKTIKAKPKNQEASTKDKKRENKGKKGIAVKVMGNQSNQQKGSNKENQHLNKVYNNSVVKKPFGTTTIWWDSETAVGGNQQFQYPTYLPVVDCVNPPPKGNKAKPGVKNAKKGSKLHLITATSVAVPFAAPVPCQMMDKSSSIEISIDKHNFDYSSNNNSKVSGPLRESELLDFNRRNMHNNHSGQFNEYEPHVHRDAFMQSQERRLPLSKISSENSGGHQERVTNGISGHHNYINMNEIPEEMSLEYAQQMEYHQSYTEKQEEEPMPNPLPQTVTNYKELRDAKKWQKVNSGMAIF